ncbi:CNGC5-like protein [Corchorus olitorius]|uniref:CNGC5-like protein n=1 Tax=Corchorus olitorius TaxID=93759 RepID=A0A1R3KVU6_9ROSI|nr:CNGC5-like protein [Corchorus olitorius]
MLNRTNGGSPLRSELYEGYLSESICPKIPITEAVNLGKEISVDEVYKALHQMKPWKAPGVDGFHAGFFHQFLGTTKDALFEIVTNAFEVGVL